MRPPKQPETGQMIMLRARLDQILNLDHELVRLGRLIDWRFIEDAPEVECIVLCTPLA